MDYSINAEVGVPLMTGPTGLTAPVNHVLPAWDMITGMLVVSAVSSPGSTCADRGRLTGRDRVGRRCAGRGGVLGLASRGG